MVAQAFCAEESQHQDSLDRNEHVPVLWGRSINLNYGSPRRSLGEVRWHRGHALPVPGVPRDLRLHDALGPRRQLHDYRPVSALHLRQSQNDFLARGVAAIACRCWRRAACLCKFSLKDVSENPHRVGLELVAEMPLRLGVLGHHNQACSQAGKAVRSLDMRLCSRTTSDAQRKSHAMRVV